jgi:hypothetical protein
MKNSLHSTAIIAHPTTPKLRRHGKEWLARLASIKRTRFSLCQTSWRGFTFSAIDLEVTHRPSALIDHVLDLP